MTERQIVQLHPAYLLHARPYRDSSAIADFFTQEHGRIALVARGVRRPKSTHRAALQPFLPVLLSWTTRSSLGTLTGLELANTNKNGLPKNLTSGYYVNELVMRAVHGGECHQDLFARYSKLLQTLATTSNEASALRVFERDLLDDLGYGMRLDFDGNGKPLDSDAIYRVDVHEGPLLIEAVPPDQRTARIVRGQTLIDLNAGELNDSRSLQEAKHLLRDALAFHLGNFDSKVREVVASMHSHRRRWQNESLLTDEGVTPIDDSSVHQKSALAVEDKRGENPEDQ